MKKEMNTRTSDHEKYRHGNVVKAFSVTWWEGWPLASEGGEPEDALGSSTGRHFVSSFVTYLPNLTAQKPSCQSFILLNLSS